MPHIEFDHVTVSFDEFTALSDVSLSLTEHRIGIIGANGEGKSTLTRLINGLTEPSAGRVIVNGLDVSHHGKDVRKQVGFVFSDAENQIVMPTVREDVDFSLRRMRLNSKERDRRVSGALERFGLSDLSDRSPHTLSGGQKQLLALAAVLVMEPAIIIADEPTTLLDMRNRDRIAREFSALEQQLIVVTHDLDFVSDFDRVICIDDHRVACDGPPAEAIAFYRALMSDAPQQGGDTWHE